MVTAAVGTVALVGHATREAPPEVHLLPLASPGRSLCPSISSTIKSQARAPPLISHERPPYSTGVTVVVAVVVVGGGGLFEQQRWQWRDNGRRQPRRFKSRSLTQQGWRREESRALAHMLGAEAAEKWGTLVVPTPNYSSESSANSFVSRASRRCNRSWRVVDTRVTRSRDWLSFSAYLPTSFSGSCSALASTAAMRSTSVSSVCCVETNTCTACCSPAAGAVAFPPPPPPLSASAIGYLSRIGAVRILNHLAPKPWGRKWCNFSTSP